MNKKFSRNEILLLLRGVVIGMLTTIIIVILIMPNNYFKSYMKNMTIRKHEQNIKSNIKYLEDENAKYDNVKNQNLRMIKNFSLEKDTVTIHNIKGIYSESGNCAGYTVMEMVAYMNRYKQNPAIINGKTIAIPQKHLGDYKILGEDIKNFNKINASTEDEDIIYDKMLDKKYKKYPFDYSQYLQDKDLADLFNYISFYQINQLEYQKIFSIPSSKFDLNEFIVNKIENNEPVGIGINSPLYAGHAVLAYGYEKINDNIYKVYVADSNLPINLEPKTEQQRNNNEKIKNTYILFVKGNNGWEYIYNPHVEVSVDKYTIERYIYQGLFNSYIDGSTISVYSIK